MNINETITALVNYSIKNNLISECDKTYTINRILEILNLNEYEHLESSCDDISVILNSFCDYAVEQGIIEDSILYGKSTY